MKVVTLKDLQRKNEAIHYRREFSGSVVFEYVDKKPIQKRIEFVLEHGPMGGMDVRVSILDELEYPLLPVLQSLKTYITDLDRKGQLP